MGNAEVSRDIEESSAEIEISGPVLRHTRSLGLIKLGQGLGHPILDLLGLVCGSLNGMIFKVMVPVIIPFSIKYATKYQIEEPEVIQLINTVL